MIQYTYKYSVISLSYIVMVLMEDATARLNSVFWSQLE